MSERSIRQRCERGVILAAIQRPYKTNGAYVVNGWFTDGNSCACPDHEHTGATCKHMIAATIWAAREATASRAS